MKTLAIDTSTRQSSVALFAGEQLCAAQRLDASQPTTAVITPTLKNLLREAGWKAAEIDLVAVSQGPGSFTGLRIGIVTAKTICYATNARCLGVNTLRSIAARYPGSVSRLHVVMDAQRNEFFHCVSEPRETTDQISVSRTQILSRQVVLDLLSEGESITGPGLRRLLADLPPGVSPVDESFWDPSAEAVGRIAIEDHRSGKIDDFWNLVPNYFRQSAAEEKLQS